MTAEDKRLDMARETEELLDCVRTLQTGTASAEAQLRAARKLLVLRETLRELEKQARRARHVVDFAQWHRDDSEHDGHRTWLCVRVADHADLSCKALREDALDAAIQDETLR